MSAVSLINGHIDRVEKNPQRDKLIELLDKNYMFAEDIADHLLENGVIVPPCKVGDKYYRVELWCTEGGYCEESHRAYDSNCDGCCEECDGKERVVEYTFNSVIQILEAEPYFHKSVFLTREEAEAKLKGESK